MSSKKKKMAVDWIEDNKELIVDVHQKIWEWAEVGLQELKSGKLMADILEENGFDVERGVAGMPSAFVATYGSGKPVIGMMGELDALPSISNKAVPYREPVVEGGPGHSWQHVAVGGMSIGHKSTVFASKVMATTVLDLLSKPELLKKVREDWEQRMEGLTYKSPLPPDLKPPLHQLEKQPE